MPMTKRPLLASGATLAVLAVFGSAISSEDRFALKAPNGIAFSEFKGYENWPDVALSHDEHDLKLIAANETMGSLFPMAPRLRRSAGLQKRTRKPPFRLWCQAP